jgi:S-methylmethionine-dependent homocysteine/selenocysteine methylase
MHLAVDMSLCCPEHGLFAVLGVLFNCALPESITQALKTIHEDSSLQRTMKEHAVITGAYANRLTAVGANWSLGESDATQPTRDDLSVERYSNEFVSSWVKDLGASIVGGCCGITPEYIADIHKTLRISEVAEPR